MSYFNEMRKFNSAKEIEEELSRKDPEWIQAFKDLADAVKDCTHDQIMQMVTEGQKGVI